MTKYFLIVPVFFFSVISTTIAQQKKPIDKFAADYVRLGLEIGEYDQSFVDAYYGPDSLKPTSKAESAFPKEKLLQKTASLITALEPIAAGKNADANRAAWMISQLRAYERRIKIFSGEYASFDEESKELFGVQAPKDDENFFRERLRELDRLLPGTGDVFDRFQQLANRFVIPKEKIDTVFKTAIMECRRRTLKYFPLPAEEKFQLELVNNKPWSGYNWYKGNYQSLIQINTDINIFIDRAIDVGSHESYPGHHVYNMLLEQNLYRKAGYVEISLYPLFSPQSLIAEGSGNYGIDLAFPGNDRIVFTKNVLLPLAGLDTTGISLYFHALAIRGQLNFIRNEVARGLLNGTMDEPKAMDWLMRYGLLNEETAKKSIDFIRINRSYVINYNYGLELVRRYVEKMAGKNASEKKRWEVFHRLLREQVLPNQLL